ncbi:MAG: 1-deoxy-D-xylulose-5-phosphate reductoisomerase [Pirellulaceae bacterium]|nr:1-deoxy-D-xylulose-5-phosphate reductoisomerase [Pirellulaceae bacterium]
MSNVAILGSTGSIGCSTLEVIDASAGRLHAHALTAHSRMKEAVQQAQHCRPRWLVATSLRNRDEFSWSDLPAETEVLVGAEGIERVVTDEAIDVVVAAIVGSAGLDGTWAAIEAGKCIALANKETLVVAGSLVMQLARERNAPIIPVDSEHSAIFQALSAGKSAEVKRIVLTASGGPFRDRSLDQMNRVTPAEALAHPTWKMGPKITIDSATMMNKALEIIEARWLFDLRPDQIQVMVHPQSIVHSLVEFVDGSVVAQLGPPDMKLPIQYALTYPQRWEGVAERMDWSQPFQLTFDPPDEEKFPAIALGHEVARLGGTSGVVVNAANEAAVQGFLDGRLRFTEIVRACKAVLEHHEYDAKPTLADLNRLDTWAREEVFRWICT